MHRRACPTPPDVDHLASLAIPLHGMSFPGETVTTHIIEPPNMVTITTGGINPTGTMHTLSGCSVYYFGTVYTIQLPNKEEGTCFKIMGKVFPGW